MSLGVYGCKTKKDLKARVGKRGDFYETSMFGNEFPSSGTGRITVVGPDAYHNRKWYATVELKDGLIAKVS